MTEVTNTTAAPVETTVATTVAETTTVQPSFVSTLSEDMRTNKTLEKFKDVNELAKSYINIEKLASGKNPTAPEKYVLPDDAMKVINDKILETAKKGNITQEQMKMLTDSLVESKRSEIALAESEANTIMETRVKALESEFGPNLDARKAAVKKILTQYGDATLEEDLNKTGLLHDVKFVKFLDKITQDVLQVKMVGSDYVKQLALTPAEASQKLAKKMGDMEFRKAFYSALHPAHKEAVNEFSELNQLANSTSKG